MGITRKDLEICHSLALEANDIRHRLERLEAFATKSTSSIAGVPSGGGGTSDRVGDGVAAYLDLREEGLKRIEAYLEHVTAVERHIDGLANSTHRRLLRLRYIDGKKWTEIEDEMLYAERHLRRMHNDALEILCREDVLECPVAPKI